MVYLVYGYYAVGLDADDVFSFRNVQRVSNMEIIYVPEYRYTFYAWII